MDYDASITKIKDRKSIGAMVIARFDSKGKFSLQQSKADSFKAITKDYSENEKTMLFSSNAEKYYRI